MTQEMTITADPPVCSCGLQLPNFLDNRATMVGVRDGDVLVEAITYHVRCKCGASWDLKKWTREGGVDPRPTSPRAEK